MTTCWNVKTGLITATCILACSNLFAQKVANYAFGKLGTQAYEHFPFWTEDGKRTRITYTYGKDSKDLTATYAGKGSYQGTPCFKITLPNQQTLYVIPSAYKLQVRNAAKTCNKISNWEYEGPVNGVGTYCEVCTQDEKEAMLLLRKCYLK
ncbi:hypothetical protein [Mucilaginibacter sp. CSA2-8R]|uniref:hypothetical protein n=1 Tax=Mucilaginibacter sp. CSA2-8R TaxID=3141542 RepID=UPI00315D17EA